MRPDDDIVGSLSRLEVFDYRDFATETRLCKPEQKVGKLYRKPEENPTTESRSHTPDKSKEV